jgi:polyisoprenoid-binding protein YceI
MPSSQKLQTPAPTTSKDTAATWDLDPSHSEAEFSVKHMMIATVKGRMAVKTGSFHWDEAHPERSTATAEVDPATVHTGSAPRDDHLRSADFFDAVNYSAISFRATKLQALGDDLYRAEGELTIRGTMQPVVIEIEKSGEIRDPWGKYRAGLTATTTIDRRDFGLTWNQALEVGGVLVGDKVRVTLHLEAVRRE